MSHSCSDLSSAISNPVLQPLSIKEMWTLSTVDKNKFSFEDYTLPKNQLYLVRENRFPLEKRPEFDHQAQKRAKEPDPGKYNDPNEKTNKRYWEKSNGKFLKGKRITDLDENIKRSKSVPASNNYFKELPKLDERHRAKKFGKFE